MRIVFLIFLVIGLKGFEQTNSTLAIEYDSTTAISLESGGEAINKTQLDSGFTVKLSDPNAKLISFSLVYSFDNGETHGFQQISFQGNRAFIDSRFPKLGLFKDPKSNFVTLENVYFERNGKRYKARSLFIPLK